MAQGDQREVGYVQGTPDQYLASIESSRTVNSIPVEVQEVTHGHGDPISGRAEVTVAGTRVRLNASSLKARQVVVQYPSGNPSGAIITVGGSGVVAAEATRNGYELRNVGDFVILECDDLTNVWIDSTISLADVIFNYWRVL